ncbi:two-component sensor histidine kinase [Croceicoccus naphthovorans]|uniref:histidine kinase n=1 Tax=Croceicoccus naphthovorans TaxID=1348774 RepID=A0A0G3XEQ0_9SPHN|nr:two-component sensor histidine kinase [Croceicoccus naphthovorans]AKM09106.1 hypothetical protein AB433_02605 [Croceicoccus naphthovorans]MBB3991649.1 signal transduction histidine kinase [Croceicoccus naphthovorans]
MDSRRFNQFLTPGTLLIVSVLIGILASTAILLLASTQPRFTESLRVTDNGVVLRDSNGQTLGVNPQLPNGVTILSQDLIPEPDVLRSYAEQDRFFARQDELAQVIGDTDTPLTISFRGSRPGAQGTEVHQLTPGGNLPFEFWLQMLVGFAGFLVSAWIWSLHPRSLPNQMFGLTGVFLWLAASTAAIYSTRWLALPAYIFETASALNGLGAVGFGWAMICLFLVYPVRIAGNATLMIVTAILGGWLLLSLNNLMLSPTNEAPLQSSLEMAAILVLVIVQFVISRRKPLEHAAIRWVGVSTVIGSGLFICTVIVPSLLGAAPLIDQSFAFAFFLIVHLGTALGLRRQLLFASEVWAISMFKATLIGLLLITVDVVLIAMLGSLSGATVLTMLLILPFFYLPWRRLMQSWLFGSTQDSNALEQVAHGSLLPSPTDRRSAWKSAMEQAFSPLEVVELEPDHGRNHTVAIVDHGTALRVPEVMDSPPLLLQFKQKGLRLFQERDRKSASRMFELAVSLKRKRDAFEEGVASERSRISRDLHDDLSARLVSGLALDDPAGLKDVLRSSLAEVRTIVNAEVASSRELADVIADCRAEAADRLEAAGIGLEWPLIETSALLDPAGLKEVSSIIREIVTNAIKHSSAKHMTVQFYCRENRAFCRMSDDGIGDRSSKANTKRGRGLENITTRMRSLGGHVEIDGSGSGFTVSFSLPVRHDTPTSQ